MAASAVAVYECVYEWVNVTIQCKPICHLSFTILLILCLAVYCWFFSDYEISVTGVNACTSLQLIKSLLCLFSSHSLTQIAQLSTFSVHLNQPNII